MTISMRSYIYFQFKFLIVRYQFKLLKYLLNFLGFDLHFLSNFKYITALRDKQYYSNETIITLTYTSVIPDRNKNML